jgi:ABC-type lipoprotein export system ATPase subunit
VVYLAHEPTGNLDTRTSADVIDLLAGLAAKRGSTIIVATHGPGPPRLRAAVSRDARRSDRRRRVAAELAGVGTATADDE